MSPGPFIIGVLAINQSDPDDIDATRIVASMGLLAEATPGGHGAATHDKSETLDGLTPASVTVNPNGGDTRIPIEDGSHWTLTEVQDDLIFDRAAVDIVNLSTESLPSAAQADLGSYIAGGNGLRMSFDPTTWTQPEAARLLSRAFLGLQAGEVYTFALNIATDIADATHSPELLMSMSSGLGAGGGGMIVEHVYVDPGLIPDVILNAYQQDIIPQAADGWQTLSVNYTPPLTDRFFDVEGADGDYDAADKAVLEDLFGNPASAAYEGWTDEKTVAKATFRVNGHDDMTSPFNVWIDNLRVYRSAYEADLGLEVTEYVTPATLTGLLPTGIPPQTGGSIDGTFETYTTTLDAIGFVTESGEGLIDEWQRDPLGPFVADAVFADASSGSLTVAAGPDHTASGGSGTSLQIQMSGTLTAGAGTPVALRSWIDTGVVAVPGSGVYAMELYMTKTGGRTDGFQDAGARTPKYVYVMNQVAPNPLGPAYGNVMTLGGTPNSLADDGWARVVGTGYISDRQEIAGKGGVLIRGVIQTETDLGADPANFNAIVAYVDDVRLVRIDDPAKFFDADLFDSI
jgi:hypothetical protein